MSTTPTRLAQTFSDYFTSTFTSSHPSPPRVEVIHNCPTLTTSQDSSTHADPVGQRAQHQHDEFNPRIPIWLLYPGILIQLLPSMRFTTS
jgi:hypothetical protein